MRTIRIATRASDLARVQSGWVARRLEEALGVSVELRPMKTTGDRLVHQPLARVGGKGLFVKEIQEALLQGEADLAVHSAKDLPAFQPDGLVLAGFPERADPRDALLTRERGLRLETLPPGSRVGTGSLRRMAQLRALRPDLRVEPLRGNVPTRIRKLDRGELDALVLACAGLDRLGLDDRIDERVATADLLPAVGQGALALEARADDRWAREAAAAIAHAETERAVVCERAFLIGLAGDCTTPLAAFAEPEAGGGVRLRALLADPGGQTVLRAQTRGIDPTAAGRAAAEDIRGQGGDAILASLREGEAG